MTGQREQTKTLRIYPIGVLVGVGASLLLLGWLLFGGDARPLKPFRPTATPGDLMVNSQPILVTFDQLNSDPNAFRGQRIRVTGSYVPQEKSDCFDFSGPDFRWALISSDLQLNGLGYEKILGLVPNGTTLTVDGVWQLYDGPFGCGKGPARAQIWYLQIERIVAPNPLPNFGPLPENNDAPPNETPVTGDSTAVPQDGTATAVPLPTSQTTPEPGTTSSPTPTATRPLEEGTATPSPTPTNTSDPTRLIESSPTATLAQQPNGSPTATATPILPSTPGTGTATPTTSPLITSTPGPSPTTGPSPTSGSGYPPPPDTTSTPPPY